MSRIWTLATLGLLLLAPLALAAEGEGSFVLQGALRLPDFAEAESSPLAVFLADTSRPDGAQVQASKVTVHRFEKRLLTATLGGYGLGQVQSGFHVDSWTLHNVTLVPRQGGNHSGYAGVYPASGASIVFAAVDDAKAQPAAFSAVGSAERSDGNQPHHIHYYVTVEQPHLLLTGVGTVAYAGSGGVKISGMDVEIRASENITYHETGSPQSGPAEVTYTWLYLQFDAQASVVFAGPLTLATDTAGLRWDGAVLFTASEGELRTPQGTYRAVGGPAKLDGRFSGRLVPLAGEQGRLEIAGEVGASSMTYVPAPSPRETDSGDSPASAALVVGAAVVVLGGGALAAGMAHARRQRSHRSPVGAAFPFSAEDCMQASEKWADAGEWARALEWAQRARTLAPTSGEAAGQAGWALDNLGDAAGAFSAYAEAARLLPSEADFPFLAAQRARVLPDHTHEIEDFLKMALERDRGHAFDIEQEFPEVAGKPEWRKLLRDAWARANADEGEPKA